MNHKGNEQYQRTAYSLVSFHFSSEGELSPSLMRRDDSHISHGRFEVLEFSSSV